MKLPLIGIVPPMVTPLRGRDELDVAGLDKLIAHILSAEVAGLFILGTTGEGPALSYRLRREVVERVCEHAGNRVPVLVGITDTIFEESVSLARHSAKVGASALVVAPPYYLPPSQPELMEYLNHLIAEVPLPVFLYNMPALTKVSFDLETVRRAMDNPRIIGFKDSSGDLAYFKAVAEMIGPRRDWSLLIGPEERLFDALQLGGHGGVSGGANLFPKLYVALCAAHASGDLTRARELQAQIQRVSDALYRVGKHSSSIVKGIKCALNCLGVCDDFMAEPFHRFRDVERALVQQRLGELKADLEKFKW